MLSTSGASPREIAAAVGLAPSTVKDVRDRMNSGLRPVPDRERARDMDSSALDDQPKPGAGEPARDVAVLRWVRAHFSCLVHTAADGCGFFGVIRPTRFHRLGRHLIRSAELDLASRAERSRVADAIPAHCAEAMIGLAQQAARGWDELARQFNERSKQTTMERAQR